MQLPSYLAINKLRHFSPQAIIAVLMIGTIQYNTPYVHIDQIVSQLFICTYIYIQLYIYIYRYVYNCKLVRLYKYLHGVHCMHGSYLILLRCGHQCQSNLDLCSAVAFYTEQSHSGPSFNVVSCTPNSRQTIIQLCSCVYIYSYIVGQQLTAPRLYSTQQLSICKATVYSYTLYSDTVDSYSQSELTN